MAQKHALLIGNDHYADKRLTALAVPAKDVRAFEEVLQDKTICDFDHVLALHNPTINVVLSEIGRLFVKKSRDDLLLLYFSGHGLLDTNGHLHLALKDTKLDQPLGTALDAAFIRKVMDNSRSQRQVLVLDCCYSGAFKRGAKGAGQLAITEKTFSGDGYGQAVLTSSTATQMSWEGDQVIGETDKSLFTHYLVDGLTTGKAAAHGQDTINIDDLYSYTHDCVARLNSKMTPQRWIDHQQGNFVIARNPHPVIVPASLPTDWQEGLDNDNYLVRKTSVQEIAGWLRSETPAEVVAAKQALETRLQSERDFGVRATITALLENNPLPTEPVVTTVTRIDDTINGEQTLPVRPPPSPSRWRLTLILSAIVLPIMGGLIFLPLQKNEWVFSGSGSLPIV